MNYEKYKEIKEVNDQIQELIDRLILLKRTPGLKLEEGVRRRLDSVYHQYKALPVGLPPVQKPKKEKERFSGKINDRGHIDRDFTCPLCGKSQYNYTKYSYHLSHCKGNRGGSTVYSPKTWTSDHTIRDNGRYGSFPDHDDYSEESFA